MGTKTNVIVLIVIVVIFLFIAILFKIKSDKKRKSLAISYAEREKNINNDKNEPYSKTLMQKGKRPNLWGIPSWGLASLTMVGVFVVLMAIVEELVDNETEEILAYIILGVVNAICCFFIVRQNPQSIWYVPWIINVLYIISAFVEYMKALDRIAICGIFILSLIASIIGAQMGKRKAISDNH
jgi:surface polysaccharide O-acyltransferase-like enzyme